MAIKVPMVKTLGALRPSSPDGEEALRTIANGKEVMVTITQSRNIRHHKMWWAMCGLVAENLDCGVTSHAICEIIKRGIGHYEEYIVNGIAWKQNKSISFAKMDQTEFSLFFNSGVEFVCNHVIPGMEANALRREIEEICGLHPEAA